MTVTGNICGRPSCDNSEMSSGGGYTNHSYQLGKKNIQAALNKRRSTLDTHKNNMSNIYEKIRSCLEAAGDVSDCLDDKLGMCCMLCQNNSRHIASFWCQSSMRSTFHVFMF